MYNRIDQAHLPKVAFPIVVHKSDDSSTPPSDLRGTCFGIGGGYFFTAGHVIGDFPDQSSGQIPLFGLEVEGDYAFIDVKEFEILGCDAGILYVPESLPYSDLVTQLPWQSESIFAQTLMTSPGFCHGVLTGRDRTSITMRMLHGYIISHLKSFEPLALGIPPFPALELSFMIPKQHSGAPLVYGSDAIGTAIAGHVFGTNSVTLLATTQREVDVKDGKETVYIREESIHYGVAAPCHALLSLVSNLLNGSVGQHLHKHGLLIT